MVNIKKQFILIILSLGLILTVSASVIYFLLFSPPQPKSAQKFTFIVSREAKDSDTVNELFKQGYIKSIWAFNLVRTILHYGQIPSGGFNISKNKNVWQIAKKLTTEPPDMKWITIPEGWRKEQIGEKLAHEFNWSSQDLTDWNNKPGEGTYYPDTYLIPVLEKSSDVAQRMINHFNEKFAPFMGQFAQKDILWTTGLKIASLIQRETANPSDMPIISGIIWNRLLSGMKLQIDATIQYAKGKTDGQWWATVLPGETKIDSPYNTYLYKGLPPTPICNPGLDAISAALNPAQTDCLFYLHDKEGIMHCSKTYTEHLQNVDKFLK